MRTIKSTQIKLTLTLASLLLLGALSLALPAGAFAAAAAPATITGTTYYVSPSGSDSNSGTSSLQAWKTVQQVNRASVNLKPGDGVLFQSGAAFTDSTLMPGWGDPLSGTAANPIVFGSYGGGRAIITQGVWFPSGNYLTFDNVALGPQAGLQGGSSNGSTSNHIVVQRCRIDLGPNAGVGSAVGVNALGDDWTLLNNVVTRTGDSGMLLRGDSYTISHNHISNTGLNRSIPYGLHGIYLKVSNALVTGNVITNFRDDGISVRYRDSVLSGNTISGGSIGIGWFQYDPTAGTSQWTGNTISNTTDAGIYVSPSDIGGPTRESFVITGNALNAPTPASTWAPLNLSPTTGTYTVGNNS